MAEGPLVVAATSDPASMNIARSLIDDHRFVLQEGFKDEYATYSNGWLTLLLQKKECIYVEPDDVKFGATSIFFASKHRSASGTPALTVHATGNLTSQAEFGGKPEEIALVEPFRLREAISAFTRRVVDSKLDIEVSMEATHHGPTSFPIPVCFVEIGSGPAQWSDPTLGKVVANAILAGTKANRDGRENAVGFGGTHYSAKHTGMNVLGAYNIGHIVPKYAFDRGVREEPILETFRKTAGGCRLAVVDWKGIKGDDRRTLLAWLEAEKIEVIRV